MTILVQIEVVLVYGIGGVWVSKKGQLMLYIVGKLIYWRFIKSMLTLTKVSKGGVMALHPRVSIIQILTFRE